MKITKYNKLVRDSIIDIIEQDGKQAIYTKIDDKYELLSYLDQKLNEEIEEYNISGDIEELADVMEVIHAILKAKECDTRHFNNIMKDKRKKNGSFDKGIILLEVIE